MPFDPRGKQDLLCRECHKVRQTKLNERREARAPRKKHGTRVSFPIDCTMCGAEETLDYVPKGLKLSEALCSDCVRATYGDKSRWQQISETKALEAQREWTIECATCGREDYLNFEPKPEREYQCVRCFHDQARPRHAGEPTPKKKRIGRAVYVRRGGSDDG